MIRFRQTLCQFRLPFEDFSMPMRELDQAQVDFNPPLKVFPMPQADLHQRLADMIQPLKHLCLPLTDLNQPFIGANQRLTERNERLMDGTESLKMLDLGDFEAFDPLPGAFRARPARRNLTDGGFAGFAKPDRASQANHGGAGYSG